MHHMVAVLVLSFVATKHESKLPPVATPQTAFFEVHTQGPGPNKPLPYEACTPSPSQQELERTVLKKLGDGHQAEAEELLEKHVSTIPDAMDILAVLRQGNRTKALQYIRSRADVYRANHRLLYLYAACERSRFSIEEAIPRFTLAGMAHERTVLGQSTFCMIALDGVREVQKNPDRFFNVLEQMVASHPEEIILRWMLAVECRSYHRNEQGVRHYQSILKQWRPGPVLVHQTYANLLDDLKRYDEALPSRRIAVAMEPNGWSYNGLGNTLRGMKRYDEAYDAYRQATQLSPNHVLNWANWADALYDDGKYDEGIAKAWRATVLARNYPRAWYIWARCLAAKGDYAGAFVKCLQAMRLIPRDPGRAPTRRSG